MSRVYRARDRQLGRLVAIKVLHERYADDPAYVDRFRREAQAVARLTHPNIVTVIDRGEADGRQYIVFEHVQGEDLKQPRSRASGRSRSGAPRARRRDRAGTRVRSRQRRRPSRREAAERPAPRRQRQGDRLRNRARRRPRARERRDGHRDDPRDRRLHLARAGPRRARDRAERRLLARRAALRAPDRTRAVPGRQCRRRALRGTRPIPSRTSSPTGPTHPCGWRSPSSTPWRSSRPTASRPWTRFRGARRLPQRAAVALTPRRR